MKNRFNCIIKKETQFPGSNIQEQVDLLIAGLEQQLKDKKDNNTQLATIIEKPE